MAEFIIIQCRALALIMALMTVLWIISLIRKNAGIADIFWGAGFAVTSVFYYFSTRGHVSRKTIVMILTIIWGLRLSVHILLRNLGKGEDFRYRKFREDYGEKNYRWISYFQVFLLQGILMILVSSPLLGAMIKPRSGPLNIIDYTGIGLWLIGFIFEAGSDYELTVFKRDPDNRGRLLTRGFWRFSRHPNYFGDAAVWWGFGLLSAGGGSYIPIAGSLLMTFLLLKVSGVALIEKTIRSTKPGYEDYMNMTNSFFPWLPRKKIEK